MPIIRGLSRRKAQFDENMELLFSTTRKPDEQGRTHVALYSEFFSNLTGKVLTTNAAYANLKDEISASIEFCDPKDKIVIDIFEPTASSDFDRNTAIIGYRRYIAACYRGYLKHYAARRFLFALFLGVGVSMMFLMYGLKLFSFSKWPTWLYESVATMFVWQYFGYMAFEWHGERKRLQRLSQMRDLEFEFKLWE